MKIKANNLMPGDWLEVDGSYVQVTMMSLLGGDVVRVMAPFMSYDTEYAADNAVSLSQGSKQLKKLQPVTLTMEILEQFGFEINELDEYVIKSGKKSIIVNYNDMRLRVWDGDNLIMSCDIPEYVHQFQHIIHDYEYDDIVKNPILSKDK